MTGSRSVIFHELGGPEVLRLEASPERAPEAGEVRLRVHAIGLNRADALFRRGEYTQKPELPSRIGYDAVGVVDAVGPGVERWQVGARVATIPAFAMTRHGVYADVATVPEHAVVPWPEALDAPHAAALWTAWLTVWGGLLQVGSLRAGDWVLLSAASSSVGLAAIQIAHAEGARVIATTRAATKRDALLAAGADHVIVTQSEDLVERVSAITAGHGVDLAFDAVAGAQLDTLARAMADSGRIVIYGYLGGMATPLPLVPLLRKALTLRAHSMFRTTLDAAAVARSVEYITRGVARGAFQPRVDRVFSLEQIVEAHRYLEGSEQVGKIVVVP